jgi:hypothetical protein
MSNFVLPGIVPNEVHIENRACQLGYADEIPSIDEIIGRASRGAIIVQHHNW